MISRRNLFSMVAGAAAAPVAALLPSEPVRAPIRPVQYWINPIDPEGAHAFIRQHIGTIARQMQAHLSLNPSRA